MSGEESEIDNFLFAGLLSERKISNYMQEYVLYYEFYTVGTLFRKGRYFLKVRLYILFKIGELFVVNRIILSDGTRFWNLFCAILQIY